MFTHFQLCLRLFAVMCLGAAIARGADTGKMTYCVQLIRGSNDAKPPVPGGATIGPKLTARLRPVFSWTNYWEIARQEVSIADGQKARVRLSKEREVEIDLAKQGKRTVSAFSGGELMRRTTQPIGEDMTVIGGDRDEKTAWFIIVRRDKPSK